MGFKSKLTAEHYIKSNEGVLVYLEDGELTIEYKLGLRFKIDKTLTEMIKACLKEEESWQ